MKNKIKIGNLDLNSCISLAPMAGITDYVLRNLVRKYSNNCLITTEMISSEALIQEAKRKKPLPDGYENLLVKREKNHSPIAYQLTGHKPELMRDASLIVEKYADIIDINMGCPVNKVVRGHDGCALMLNPKLAGQIVKTVKNAVKCPVSVKFRLGYTQENMNYIEFGQAMQDAGADMITIHARTRSQMYSGKADWQKINALVKKIQIPVFANGDINSVDNAIECLKISEAQGLAVARGILRDASLISRIEHYFETGEKLPEPEISEKMTMMKKLLDDEIKLRGEDVGIKFVRKYYPFYVSGFKNAAKLRSDLIIETDYGKIIRILNSICDKFHLSVF